MPQVWPLLAHALVVAVPAALTTGWLVMAGTPPWMRALPAFLMSALASGGGTISALTPLRHHLKAH